MAAKARTAILCVKTSQMNHVFSTLAVAMVFFATGCFHPVSTMFETAHSLDKGDTRVTMGGTLNPETETSLAGGSFLGIVDHGLAEKTDLRVRLERRVETEEFGIPYSYLEVGTKWSFKNNWAFSLPLSFYFVEGGGSMRFLNPRFMFSQRISEKHEFTGVFHTKVGTVDGGFGFIPGAAIGLAVGNDIDVKALRLEAGYNAMNQITFGLGWQFSNKQRSNSLQQGLEPSEE